jgi:hypothetical protein
LFSLFKLLCLDLFFILRPTINHWCNIFCFFFKCFSNFWFLKDNFCCFDKNWFLKLTSCYKFLSKQQKLSLRNQKLEKHLKKKQNMLHQWLIVGLRMKNRSRQRSLKRLNKLL